MAYKNSYRVASALTIITFIAINAFTVFAQEAEPEPTPDPNVWTKEQWDTATPQARVDYCTQNGNDSFNQCPGIYNEIGNCYYTDTEIVPYDVISRNCRLDPQEQCLQEKAQSERSCIAESADQNNPYSVQQCNEKYICRSVNGNYQLIERNDGLPYDSEFFDVTDNEKGLSTKNQNTPEYSQIPGGPIIAFLNDFINLMAGTIGLFALVIFIYGAVMFITANGDDNKITKGKGAIKYSLIGIVFTMLSYTIVVLVQSIFF